jgi:LacI family transcriptional regulator
MDRGPDQLKVFLKGAARIERVVNRVPRVILLIESSRAFAQGILRGIAKYSHLHGPWVFYSELNLQNLKELKKWHADGIIARSDNLGRAKLTEWEHTPTIVMVDNAPIPGLPSIVTDNEKVGIMAAEYFIQRGFKHFALCGTCDVRQWSKAREESFAKTIISKGYSVHFYKAPSTRYSWEREQNCMTSWLKTLPKPIGLLASHDDRGRNVLDACELADLRVPYEVAVLGVDNDELLCDLADPPLSSIALDTVTAGYQAAALLDRMMIGQKVNEEEILVSPMHVVTRPSSDAIAVEDQDIAEALSFIRENITKKFSIDEVAEAANLSRRSLERRFRKALGCSILGEIRRIRVDLVAKMLLETSHSVSEIAASLDYPDAKYVIQTFREERGMTPLQYRKHFGLSRMNR